MKTKLLLLLMILMTLMPVGYAYAWGDNDNSDRLSNDQAGVFSPGYLNAAKQQAYSIINQNNKPKSWWDTLVDKIKNKNANDVKEDANTKVTPEVKKKTSSSQSTKTILTESQIDKVVDSTQYNVSIGSGSEQYRDTVSGRLLAERINGSWHAYVNNGSNVFRDNTGNSVGYSSIGDAITFLNSHSGGGYALVRGSTNSSDIITGDFSVLNDVKLYGGYDESGTRNKSIYNTIINGGFKVENTANSIEINGFTIRGGAAINSYINGRLIGTSKIGIYINNAAGEVRVANNTFEPTIDGTKMTSGLSAASSAGMSTIVTLYNNTFTRSTIAFSGAGTTARVEKNSITNQSSFGGVILSAANGSYTIVNNYFRWEGSNSYSHITFNGVTASEVANNTFYQGGAGVNYSLNTQANVHDNLYYFQLGGFGAPIGPNPGSPTFTHNVYNSTINMNTGLPTTTLNFGYSPATENIAYSRLSYTETTISSSTSILGPQLSIFSSDSPGNISSSNIYGSYGSQSGEIFRSTINNNVSQNAVSSIFKGLLANKDTLGVGMMTPINEAVVGRLVTESLTSAVGVPSLTATEGRTPEIQMALALANILKNPTDDQKLVLDAVESLLADMKNLEEKAGKTPELSKAENDLLQMVATCLLAQGVPDLLKQGDIEGVRGIFKDLGASKDKIMTDYNQSIKPYYSNIVKELSTNLAMLQLKGILSKKITEEELKNLEPREIDKILESIRRSNDKSFELEYILQQDAKYRKEYVDPQNKALSEAMKKMLGSLTARINTALEDKK